MQVVVFCKNVLILSNNNSNFLTSCFYPSTFVYGWFFLKDWVFLLFAKSVNWDLQILGKCISDTLFGFKAYMSYITEKHQFPCEYYGLVIKYTKSHPPNWCIKVGNTPPRLPYWWGVILFFFFFCNQTLLGQLVMFGLKIVLEKRLYGPFLWIKFNCLKATEPLRGDSLRFTTWSPGLPSTH